MKELGLESKEELTQMMKSMYMEISVTFSSPIKKHTGGKLSNKNKTITWDYEYLLSGKDLYATTAKTASKKISVNVAKNKIYKKTTAIKVKSGTGTVYLDGKRVTSGKTKATNGKHTLVIMNQNGKVNTFSFVVDTKAPTISGVKNNKTYSKKVTLKFKDGESGIKSVTVNKKKLSSKNIKNGYSISKSGKYTVKVTDKAGRSKTVKFVIKK